MQCRIPATNSAEPSDEKEKIGYHIEWADGLRQKTTVDSISEDDVTTLITLRVSKPIIWPLASVQSFSPMLTKNGLHLRVRTAEEMASALCLNFCACWCDLLAMLHIRCFLLQRIGFSAAGSSRSITLVQTDNCVSYMRNTGSAHISSLDRMKGSMNWHLRSITKPVLKFRNSNRRLHCLRGKNGRRTTEGGGSRQRGS